MQTLYTFFNCTFWLGLQPRWNRLGKMCLGRPTESACAHSFSLLIFQETNPCRLTTLHLSFFFVDVRSVLQLLMPFLLAVKLTVFELLTSRVWSARIPSDLPSVSPGYSLILRRHRRFLLDAGRVKVTNSEYYRISQNQGLTEYTYRQALLATKRPMWKLSNNPSQRPCFKGGSKSKVHVFRWHPNEFIHKSSVKAT